MLHGVPRRHSLCAPQPQVSDREGRCLRTRYIYIHVYIFCVMYVKSTQPHNTPKPLGLPKWMAYEGFAAEQLARRHVELHRMQFRKRAALVSQSECVRVRALNAATADRCVIHCSTARAIVQLGKRAGDAGRQLDGRVRADHPAPSTPCMCVLQESAHKAVMCERATARATLGLTRATTTTESIPNRVSKKMHPRSCEPQPIPRTRATVREQQAGGYQSSDPTADFFEKTPLADDCEERAADWMWRPVAVAALVSVRRTVPASVSHHLSELGLRL